MIIPQTRRLPISQSLLKSVLGLKIYLTMGTGRLPHVPGTADTGIYRVTGTNESFIEDFERCLMELDLNEHRSFSETDEVVSKLDTRPDIPSKRQGLRLHFDQVDNSAGD